MFPIWSPIQLITKLNIAYFSYRGNWNWNVLRFGLWGDSNLRLSTQNIRSIDWTTPWSVGFLSFLWGSVVKRTKESRNGRRRFSQIRPFDTKLRCLWATTQGKLVLENSPRLNANLKACDYLPKFIAGVWSRVGFLLFPRSLKIIGNFRVFEKNLPFLPRTNCFCWWLWIFLVDLRLTATGC